MSTRPNRDLSEALFGILSGVARFLITVGGLAVVASVIFLFVSIFRLQSGAPTGVSVDAAMRNIEMLQRILSIGAFALAIGIAYEFWGEEFTGAGLLIGGAVLWFAPIYMPQILGGQGNAAVGAALGALQAGGSVLGGVGIITLVVDLTQRARNRVKVGVKADALKYGKGIKEDSDRQNVFMGKCWQLPFCRKYVREKCPIYHAKRTCWKEKVGCMCEEEVIRGAMDNRAIPKDELLAAKMIPRNSRLTEAQKIERCHNCIIYNEHQRHKYKLALPGTLLGTIAIYGIFREPLLAATRGLITSADKVINMGTLGATAGLKTPPVFVELLLVLFVIVALSYALKIIEYLIFTLKV